MNILSDRVRKLNETFRLIDDMDESELRQAISLTERELERLRLRSLPKATQESLLALATASRAKDRAKLTILAQHSQYPDIRANANAELMP
jgi:hypothetical protein